MRRIRLNGKKMISKTGAHLYIKNKFDFPEYYGMNLDALWDLLCTESEPTTIHLIHCTDMKEHLGDYADKLIEVFVEASLANEHLQFYAE